MATAVTLSRRNSPGTRGRTLDSGLTEKQERFALEYLKDLNATHAADRAGYGSPHVTGSRLLANPRVRAFVEAERQARADRVRIEADDVLRELVIIMTSDVSAYEVDERGQLRTTPGATSGLTRAVESIRSITTTLPDGTIQTRTEFKLWNKLAAIRLVGLHLGMFIERHLGQGPLPLRDGAGPKIVFYIPDNGRDKRLHPG